MNLLQTDGISGCYLSERYFGNLQQSFGYVHKPSLDKVSFGGLHGKRTVQNLLQMEFLSGFFTEKYISSFFFFLIKIRSFSDLHGQKILQVLLYTEELSRSFKKKVVQGPELRNFCFKKNYNSGIFIYRRLCRVYLRQKRYQGLLTDRLLLRVYCTMKTHQGRVQTKAKHFSIFS